MASFHLFVTSALILAFGLTEAQRADIEVLPPDNLRCSFDRTHLRLACHNATAQDIVTATRELIPTPNHQLQPVHISLVNSSEIEILPDFLSQFNRSLRMVTVSRTSLRKVPEGTFSGLSHNLVHLDLSKNKLESLPYALRGLTALEYLDLSYNRISVFYGDVVFRAPLNLLTLDLSHNMLGQSPGRRRRAPKPAEGRMRYRELMNNGLIRHRRELSYVDVKREVSLGDAVETVHYLDLSHNGLDRFPGMLLHRQLPYLKVLKITNNSVPDYPVITKRKLPRLQKLYLENNKISWLPSYSLQRGLAFINYLDNPVHCACDTLRLREFIELHNIEAILPNCHEPDSVKGFSFRDLPQDLCQVTTTTTTSTTTNAPTTTTVTEPSTLSGKSPIFLSPVTILTNITAGYDQIRLMWMVDYQQVASGNGAFRPGDRVRWYSMYREFGTSNKTTLKISSDVPSISGNQSYEYIIADLKPTGSYIVCFKSNRQEIDSSSLYPPPFCQEVEMSGEKTFPVVEVAVATTVSTSTTMAIVAFCCFCCPKSLCKRRKKHKKKSPEKPRQSSQKLCEGSETEMETSKCSLDEKYDSGNVQESQEVHYIDHNDLMYTQSSPDLTSNPVPEAKTVEPYLEPIKPSNDSTKPLDVTFRGFRMDSYLGRKVHPLATLHNRRQFRRRSTTVTDVASDSEESEGGRSKTAQKSCQKQNNKWHDGKLLNYIRPMSVDNVSPTSSTSSAEMKPHFDQFFFPRAYTTYR